MSSVHIPRPSSIALGPNHPDFGKSLDYLPPPKPKSEHRPRSGRPPTPLPAHIRGVMRVERSGARS